MTVPTEWGREFTGKDGNSYVNISVPLPVRDQNGNSIKDVNGYDVTAYYNFIVAKDNFKQSSRDEGMSYFGLFKHQKDTNEPYEVKLTRSVANGDGTYHDEVMHMKSEELKKYVDASVAKSNYLKNLTSITISEKLVHERSYVDRNTHEHRKFYSVAVPVYDAGSNQTTYFTVSLNDYMVHSKGDGKVILNLPVKNRDGEDFVFNAKLFTKNEEGAYIVIAERSMTSNQLVGHFKENLERYKAENSNELPFVPDQPSENQEQEAANTPAQEEVPFLNDEQAQFPVANARMHHGR
jgi:hypothetical protein